MELHAIFKGSVQGVGFRWTLVDHAEKLHLTGIAKNLHNGSVEVIAQGSQEDLTTFLNAIQQDPGLARIDSVTSHFRPSATAYPDFRIVR